MPSDEPQKARGRVIEWKRTFVGRFVSRYPKYYGMIERIEGVIGKRPEWEDFTKQNIDAMVEMFLSGCQSSAKTYLSMLKSTLNDARDEVELPYPRFADRISVRATPSVNVYLDLDDLSRLEAWKASFHDK